MAKQPLTQEMAEARPLDEGEVAAFADRVRAEGFPFLFSVVMAVYNAEAYVEESIESIVTQTVGFEHIQLVLVNDGSSDGSGAICEDYAKRYPGNVVYVSQENAGVSAARNAGIDRAEGKYINFLDSDDKWSEDSFAWAATFFCAHPDVRLAAAKYVMFDAKTGNHRLNYKFAETRVIDLAQVYDHPQLSSSTCFFDVGVFEAHRYSSLLKVSEDTLIVNEILLDEMKYGVMSEPVYYYRQRRETDSAIDTMKDNVSWYFDTTKYCSERLFELSREKHGSVLPFIQFTVMYDLQWRVRAKRPDVLDEDQLARYRSILEGLLAEIDDYIITEQRTITAAQIAYAFCLKYGADIDDVLDHVRIEGDMLFADIVDRQGNAHEIGLGNIERLPDQLSITSVEFGDGEVSLSGYVSSFRINNDDLQLMFYGNNKPLASSTRLSGAHNLQNPFDDTARTIDFESRVPVQPGEQVAVRADMTVFGECRRPIRFQFEDEAGFSKKYVEGEYLQNGHWTIIRGSQNRLVVINQPAMSSATETEKPEEKLQHYVEIAKSTRTPSWKQAPWQALL